MVHSLLKDVRILRMRNRGCSLKNLDWFSKPGGVNDRLALDATQNLHLNYY